MTEVELSVLGAELVAVGGRLDDLAELLEGLGGRFDGFQLHLPHSAHARSARSASTQRIATSSVERWRDGEGEGRRHDACDVVPPLVPPWIDQLPLAWTELMFSWRARPRPNLDCPMLRLLGSMGPSTIFLGPKLTLDSLFFWGLYLLCSYYASLGPYSEFGCCDTCYIANLITC